MIAPTFTDPPSTRIRPSDGAAREFQQRQRECEVANAIIRKREDEYACCGSDSHRNQMDPMALCVIDQLRKSAESKRNKLSDFRTGRTKVLKDDIEAVKREISNTEATLEGFGFERKCGIGDVREAAEQTEREREQLADEYRRLVEENQSLRRRVALAQGKR